jgi:hypothetical protein
MEFDPATIKAAFDVAKVGFGTLDTRTYVD